ncbi:hypothetical protein H7C18_16360 [Cohnella sp. CBP 2801]|uniref:Uncharacterized protein n=1 Tax=Cohnella zeiphila TaxID=2761120 RepID=A0A7X0SPH5_9BACL|nr:hypothetical protein [Cohnella zeiphila]
MLCPACNALASHQPRCPCCGAEAADEGRAADWVGPYAPYGSIAMPDDGASGVCLHAASCPECRETFTIRVPLWPL